MIFFTKKGNPIIDSAIHNANWIITNYDFQNKIAACNFENKSLSFDSDSLQLVLFSSFPFTKRYNTFSYKDPNYPRTLFINKNRLNYNPEKIAIALVNEFLNYDKNYNHFENYLINNSSSIITNIIEELIKENIIMVF